jgi:hypothetical protein
VRGFAIAVTQTRTARTPASRLSPATAVTAGSTAPSTAGATIVTEKKTKPDWSWRCLLCVPGQNFRTERDLNAHLKKEHAHGC